MDLFRINVNLSTPTIPNLYTSTGTCQMFLTINSSRGVTLDSLQNPGTTTSGLTMPIACGSNELTIVHSGSTLNDNSRYIAFTVARPACAEFTYYGPYQFNSASTTTYSATYPNFDAMRLFVKGYLGHLSANTNVAVTNMHKWTFASYEDLVDGMATKVYQKKDWGASTSAWSTSIADATRYQPFYAVHSNSGNIGVRTYGTGSNLVHVLKGYYYGFNWFGSKTLSIKNNLPYNSAMTCCMYVTTNNNVPSTPTTCYTASTMTTVAHGGSASVTAGTYNTCYAKSVTISFYTSNINMDAAMKATCAIIYVNSAGTTKNLTLTDYCDGVDKKHIFIDWEPTEDIQIWRSLILTISR